MAFIKKRKENYVEIGNSPCINYREGDALAQKSHQSPPPQSGEKKVQWESGSAPSGYMFVSIKKKKRKEKKRKERRNYVGRGTLPTSIKEKETQWLQRTVSLLHHKEVEKKDLMWIRRVTRP
eukprot:1146495-Pelagomonas_calceolata.AAC.1